MTAQLRFKNLTLGYDRHPAVHHLDGAVEAGTLMAVDPDAPKVARFIQLGGEPYLIRYNSRLPIVVYVPDGVEVRYRIWAAGAETRPMERG